MFKMSPVICCEVVMLCKILYLCDVYSYCVCKYDIKMDLREQHFALNGTGSV